MLPDPETLVQDAARSIHEGVGLRAAKTMLDSASDLIALAPSPSDYELAFQIDSLRGVVERDNYEIDDALIHFAKARQLARRAGDNEQACRMALALATTANMGRLFTPAAFFVKAARRHMDGLRENTRRALGVEALSKIIQQHEIAGDLAGAEYLCRTLLVPKSRRYEPPDLFLARLVTFARLSVGIGEIAAASRILEEADKVRVDVASRLREVQWRSSVATMLIAEGDEDSASRQAIAIYTLLAVGQFDNAPARTLLERYGIDRPPSLEAARAEKGFRVTYNIFGDGNNIAIGSTNVHQVGTSLPVTEGDRDSLYSALTHLGISPEQLAELGQVLDVEEPNGLPGARTQAWLRRVMADATSATGAVAVGASGGLLGQALAQYFGLT